jgi:hypothetical protein
MANLANCAEELRKIGKAIGLLVGYALALFAGVWLFLMISRYGSEKGYYALRNHVEPDRVTIMPKPHDCDFSKAPLGDKECHYESVVTKSRDKQGDYVIVDWRRVSE